MQSASEATERRGADGAGRFVTAAAYAALFLFGLLQGLTGAFQYSRAQVLVLVPVPVAAVGFAVVMGVTCCLAGWGMNSGSGAFAPALGWVLAAFGMALPARNGTVVITNTTAGEAFLYGGALCAAIGAGICLAGLGRARVTPARVSGRPPRSGPGPSPDRSR